MKKLLSFILLFLYVINVVYAGATITRGHTFGSTDEVTHTLLHNLVDDATITKVTDADGDTKWDSEESTDEDKLRADTGGTERVIIDSRGLENKFKLIEGVDADTIADSGDGNAATATLNPTTSFVTLNCGDSDTCDITMGETNAVSGTLVTIVNISANVCDFSDSSGVSELAGAFAMGQYDSLTILYVTDRWIEVCRSNN